MTPGEVALLTVCGGAVGVAIGVLMARRPRARGVLGETASSGESRTETDARFEHLLQSLTVGVLLLDGRGYVRTVNAAGGTIFGIRERPVVGRAVIEVVPSYELDRRVRDAIAGHPSRGTIVLAEPSGERRLSVATVPTQQDNGVMVIATDETAMHEMEQTRREFVSGVSHELRTPLSSIKLMAETLVERPDDAEAQHLFLPRIKDEVDRMTRLVEDLLELARAESGRLRLRRGDVDLAVVAASAFRMFEQRAQRAGVALRLDRVPVHVDGDEHRLTQVVVNLVDNALKHTRGGGVVGISVRPRGGEAVIEVRDTGGGIPYRDLPHVFERFYVVERSRSRESSGTGLGLAIVKQIVEAHGGTVSADSTLGEGSTFRCVIPLAPAVTRSG